MTEAMPAALVTGGTGFIGSRLVRALVELGSAVTCISLPGADTSRLDGVPVDVIEVDASRSEMLRRSLEGVEFRRVFNLAAYGVDPTFRETRAMLDGNAGVVASLIEALAGRDIEMLVHVGSCAQYGMATPGIRIAEDHLQRPDTLYGAAKCAAEVYGRAAALVAGIPFTTLRLFHVYGVGEPAKRLVPYLLDRLAAGESVDLTPGEQARDLTFVDDVASAMMAASGAGEAVDGAAFNVCSGTPVTVRTIAERAANVIGGHPGLLNFGAVPYRDDEVMWQVGDPTALEAATGWRPRFSLDEGLRRMTRPNGETA